MTITKEQRAKFDAIRYELRSPTNPDNRAAALADLDALLAAYDEAQRDAERYQLLRRHCYPTAGAWQTNVPRRDPMAATPPAHYQRDFEAAIDAAMRAERGK